MRLCNLNEETLYHFFFECSHKQAFWKRFVNWWTKDSDDNLMLTLKDIILSFPKRKEILNYLFNILGQLCTWECRKPNSSLNFNLFLHKI